MISTMILSTYLNLVISILTFPYSFVDKIMNGEVEVTADQFPNFLYDEREAEELLEGNPEGWDVEKGLLRGVLCVWVSTQIF